MKTEIMILSTMKYKKDDKEKSRLGYIFCGKEGFSNRERFRGFSELGQFAEDTRFFDLVPQEFIGQKVTAEIQEVPNPTNPMKTRREFTSLTCNGKTIYLV